MLVEILTFETELFERLVSRRSKTIVWPNFKKTLYSIETFCFYCPE